MKNKLPENIGTILHIGAGQCVELPTYLASNAKHILLVEPNPKRAERLRDLAQADDRVKVLEVAVTDNANLDQLYEYNLPEASSLYRPTGLKKIFPGLRTTAQHSVSTQAPRQLLAEHRINGENNLLVVQAPGAEMAIIKALPESKDLHSFSHIWLTNPIEVFYEGASPVDDILVELKHEGYDVKTEKSTDSDWPEWELESNPLVRQLDAITLEKDALLHAFQERSHDLEKIKQSSASVQKELERTKQESADVRKQLEQIQKTNVELTQQRDQARKQAENLKVERDQARQGLETSKEELQKHKTYLTEERKRKEEFEQKLVDAKSRIQQSEANTQRFDGLEEKLANITKSITGHIDKKLMNTSKQIESSMGLQSYLEHGELPLNYHGWPISPDLALFLVEKIERNNYDLVVEFGSGTSTALFAKSILRRTWRADIGNAKRLNYSDNQAAGRDLAFISPDDEDLPKRVISFEHNKEYYEKTHTLLKNENLQKVVDLVHAPLVDYSHKGTDYLYYNCDSTLVRLASMFDGRRARILVLVDGPPGVTGPLARFPALPKLLNSMPNHSFDIVLDDCDREEEKKIAAEWEEMLIQRGIKFESHEIAFEKGAMLLRINF